MSFTQLNISDPLPEIRDILIATLSQLDFDGFEEKPDELICLIPQNKYNRVAVEALFEKYEVTFTETTLTQQNWNALWESNFEAVLVDAFCGIRAHFHKPFKGIQHEIIITPKMSFGTGHHATTYMMISQMEQLDFKQKQVADFGTGTGILSILAMKMGAASVFAVDEDDWSIKNAAENFSSNGCTSINLQKASSFKPPYKFDIILANINRNIILDNLQSMATGLHKNGNLLLSGLLQQDESDITAACNGLGLKVQKVLEKQNWISLLLDLA